MIVVLGPGRSGTSWIAALLTELGVDMGEGFSRVPVSAGHPATDYCTFEDIGVRRVNVLLKLYGHANIARYLAQRAEAAAGPWGFKDPRTLDFWPTWRAALGQSALMICTMRPWADVKESIQRAGWSYALPAIRKRWELTQELAPSADLVVPFSDLPDVKPVLQDLVCSTKSS